MQKAILKVKKGRFTTKNFSSNFLVGKTEEMIAMTSLFLLFFVYSKTDYSLIYLIEWI